MDEKKAPGEGWAKTLRDQFIAGLLVIIPLGASVLILIWLFNSVDHILQPLIRIIAGYDIPGVGFGVTVILIYLVGVIAKNVVGRKLIKYVDSLLAKVPIFRQLYRGIRQIVDAFSAPNKNNFMQVVLVDFPHKGMKAIGFVTNEMEDNNGQKLVSVMIPTSPTPTSGFLQIVREEDVIRTKISVDEALKMVVSAGFVIPDEVKSKI